MIAQATPANKNHIIYPALALLLIIAGLALPASTWLSSLSGATAAPSTSPISGGSIDVGKLPLVFEPGPAQADPSVRFAAHAAGATLLFKQSEIDLAISPAPATDGNAAAQAQQLPSDLVRLTFIGANPSATLQQGDLATGKVSYFLGSDPAQWRTGLPTYTGITYAALYPGIDLRYSADNTHLKGTYLLAPHADPNRIAWRYNGIQSATVDNQGNLLLTLNPPRTKDAASILSPQSSLLSTDRNRTRRLAGGRRQPRARRRELRRST